MEKEPGRGLWFLITTPVYFTATLWGKTERGMSDHKSPVTLLLHLFHSIFPPLFFSWFFSFSATLSH